MRELGFLYYSFKLWLKAVKINVHHFFFFACFMDNLSNMRYGLITNEIEFLHLFLFPFWYTVNLIERHSKMKV